MTDTTTVQPILQWPGGKRQLLPDLRDVFPPFDTVKRYVEPMVGGGALFFDLMSEDPPFDALINDVSPHLVNLYRQVAARPDEVIGYLEAFKLTHDDSKDYYYAIRDTFNDWEGSPPETAQQAALMCYLNRLCYNGLWRVNQSGKFNVPKGTGRGFDFDSDLILSVSEVLQRTEITQESFEYTAAMVRPGDVVYFDPPYVPLSDTSSFTAYAAGGFNHEDQQVLALVCQILVKRGARVIVSNSWCETVQELYSWKGFEFREVYARRSINRDADGRGEISEALILGGFDA